MTGWASVVRDGRGLRDLADVLGGAAPRRVLNRADFEDVALIAAARAVATAALARTETRGCHHRSDYPDTDPAQAVSRTVHEQPVATAPLS